MESFLKSACAALALIALAAPQAEAQDTTAAAAAATPAAVGSFKSWSAYTFEDKGRLMCYTQSAPTGTVGGAEGRGAAAVMVIQAPDAAARDQVSIVLGFLPQDGRNVTVTIGAKPGKGKKFTLKKFAVGRAWADSAGIASEPRCAGRSTLVGMSPSETDSSLVYWPLIPMGSCTASPGTSGASAPGRLPPAQRPLDTNSSSPEAASVSSVIRQRPLVST